MEPHAKTSLALLGTIAALFLGAQAAPAAAQEKPAAKEPPPAPAGPARLMTPKRLKGWCPMEGQTRPQEVSVDIVNLTNARPVRNIGALCRLMTVGFPTGAEVMSLQEDEDDADPELEEVLPDLIEVGLAPLPPPPPPPPPPVTTQQGFNASGVGVMSINLRNLRSGRTLLTINGRRLGQERVNNTGFGEIHRQ